MVEKQTVVPDLGDNIFILFKRERDGQKDGWTRALLGARACSGWDSATKAMRQAVGSGDTGKVP